MKRFADIIEFDPAMSLVTISYMRENETLRGFMVYPSSNKWYAEELGSMFLIVNQIISKQ